MTGGADPVARLVEDVLGGSADVGRVANDVLDEIRRGLPADRLSLLLRHPDDAVVEVGTWMAAELGPAAAPLAGESAALLSSPSRTVRFYALDVVLETATSGSVVARALTLLDDADSAVRWKAVGFLARVSTAQLEAARTELTASDPGSPHVALIGWLLSPEAGVPAPDRLAAKDALTRRYAAAAAARSTGVDDEALRAAAASGDDEVRRFARDWLRSEGRDTPTIG